MKKLDSVIAAALAFIAAGTQLSDSVDNDKAATAVSSYCDEDFYLSKLAAHLDEKLTPLQTTAQRLAKEVRWHTVAIAVAPDAKTRCLLHGLTAIISKTLADARTELATITPGIKLAEKQIAKQRQIIRRAHAIAGLSLNLDATTGAQRPGDSGEIITVDLKATSADSKPCKLQPPHDGKISGHEPIPSTLHTLKTTDEANLQAALQHDKLQLTSHASCSYTGGKTTFAAAAANCKLNTGTATVSLPQAAKRYTDVAADLQLYENNNPAESCLNANSDAQEATKPRQFFAKVICSALKSQPKTVQLPTLDGPTLSLNPTVQRAVATCLGTFSNLLDPTKATENSELVSFLKEEYGANNHAFTSKFRPLVAGKSIKIFRGGKKTTANIETLSEGEEEQDVLAKMEAERSAREDALESKISQPGADSIAKKTEDCKEEKDKEKCIKKDGCEFKDGECKAKEGVKAENDGKTTNTTGSNSFVISKAPVLLAFLTLA